MTLWACKTCETIGPAGRTGWTSAAPACSTCGHRTTVPADSAKGSEMLARWGISAKDLYAMEWRAFSYAPRVFWLASGGAWTAVCLTSKSHNLGITGTAAFLSAAWALISLVTHYGSRPRATESLPPAP